MAELKPGPAPTGRDKIFDALYSAFGGKPENRWTADKLTTALDWGTLGMLTGAYDGGKELAETGRPASLAMALMPGAKGAKAATKAASAVTPELEALMKGQMIPNKPAPMPSFDELMATVPKTRKPMSPEAEAAALAEVQALEELMRRPQAGGKAITEALQGVKAYHGSPHDFDRFDMSKIGTGEGSQAYGHGLYFAESESTAKYYRDTLTKNLGGDGTQGGFWAGKAMKEAGYDSDAARLILQKKIDEYDAGKRPFGVPKKDAEYRAAIEGGLNELAPSGRLYEVNIKADPNDFLDWDKPLSQQSESVRERVNALGIKQRDLDYQLAKDQRGGFAVIKALQNHTGKGTEGASQALREAGIPGIRYLDQGSRGAGEGSRNYVVFDDNLIEILRKYGLLPPAAGAGLAAALQSDPAQATP